MKCGYRSQFELHAPVRAVVSALPCVVKRTSCLAGMELFEEALQKWEQALTVKQRDPTSPSVTWDNVKEPELLPEELPEVSPH